MPKLTSPTIGLRIREAYLKAGMNRSQLRTATGIDYGQIIKWEKGKAQPETASLERVAAAVGRSVAELIGSSAPPVHKAAPAVKAFLESMGDRVTSDHAAFLRALDFGDDSPTFADITEFWALRRAISARARAAEDPSAEHAKTGTRRRH